MYSKLRAAGFAAATLCAAWFPAIADPSQAFDLNTPQLNAGYIEHGAAETLVPLEVEPAPEPVEIAAPPLTVADHDVASIPAERLEIAPLAEEEEEEKPSKRSLLALVDEHASTDTPDAEIECLAGAIYFESKGEPLDGQLAVAEVVINRAKSGRYPATLCGVIKQRGQFSFVRGGRLPAIPKSSPHWRKAVGVAKIAVKDLADSPAEHALAFHATYVSPGWRMKRVARVGNHIFYR